MNATEPPTPSSARHPSSPAQFARQNLSASSTPSPLLSGAMDRVATPTPSSSSSPALEPIVLSDDYVQRAQPNELRAIIASLTPLLQEARTDAAHHKLQYRMLAIESTEAMERIQVEMDMAQRETDLLNTVEAVEARIVSAPQKSDPNIRHVHADIWDSMIKETHRLKSQNAQLEQLVSQHKRMVVQQESEIATLNDRISLYRERLRENRSHLNRYRHAAGFLDSPHKSQSAQSTPWSARQRNQPPFAALLHASDLMSERGSVSPRTPRRKRAVSITPMPYQTPQTLQSTHYLQVPQTAAPLRGPQFQPFDPTQPLSSPRRQTHILEQVLAAEDSEAETDVPDDDVAVNSSSLPRTPTRAQKTSVRIPSNAARQRLFGPVRKPSIQQDAREALAKLTESRQTHISSTERVDMTR